MRVRGKHPRKHREVVIHALSSSSGLGDGALGYRSAVKADSCLSSACALPQPSAPTRSEEEPFLPPGTQCQKLFDLVIELDTIHHGMSPHPMHIEIPVAWNVYLAHSRGITWKFRVWPSYSGFRPNV